MKFALVLALIAGTTDSGRGERKTKECQEFDGRSAHSQSPNGAASGRTASSSAGADSRSDVDKKSETENYKVSCTSKNGDKNKAVTSRVCTMSEESTSTTTTTEEATKGREENSSREYSSGKLSIATQALRSATEQQSQSSDEPSVYLDFSMRKHSTKMLCLMSMRRNDGSSQEHNEGMTRRCGQTDNQRRARQESEKGKQRINCCIESDIQLPVLKSERETMFDAQLGPTGVEAPENNRTKSASTERNEYMAEKKPEAKNKVMNSRTESKRKANEQLLVTEDESRERERRMKITSSVNIKKAVELAKSDNGTTENNDSGVDGPNMQNGTRRKKPDGVDLSIGKLASCEDAGNKVFSNEKFDFVVDLPRNETFHPKEEEPGSAHRGNYAMPTAEKIQPPSRPSTEKNSRRSRKSGRAQSISANELRQYLEKMKCDHDTAVSFLIPIEYKRERHSPDELVLSSPSRFPEGSTSTEKETISKEDSSGCSVPPVPNNSTEESTSHLLSLSECATDSDTDDNNFTSAEVRLETAEIPSCWKHLLPESSPSQPNATCELAHEPSSSDGSRKASDKQLYAKSQGQHIDATQLSRRVSGYSNSGEWRSLQTTSTTSNVMPSEYARRTLNLINRHNLFCNTVTESEEELLRSFFSGRCQFSHRVKDAAFRALEAATMRARKVASDEGIIRFLSDKHSSTEVLFDAMKANRDLLPQCWICKDRENETHEEDADAFNSKACDAKLSPRSSEKRKRTESKTEEDNLTKGTKRETHAQSLHRPEESTHGLSSQGHQDHNRAASQFVEEFSLLPSNARPSHS